jgi:hypothetical protein
VIPRARSSAAAAARQPRLSAAGATAASKARRPPASTAAAGTETETASPTGCGGIETATAGRIADAIEARVPTACATSKALASQTVSGIGTEMAGPNSCATQTEMGSSMRGGIAMAMSCLIVIVTGATARIAPEGPRCSTLRGSGHGRVGATKCRSPS